MYENFPYSNFHDLNTDWIVKKIKDVETSEANAKASEENAKASEENAKVSELSAQGFALQANNHAQYAREQAQAAAQSSTEADNYVSSTRAQVNLLQSRVDNIIPSGTQTEGNTELLDIRVEYDGTIASSAGNAVREQASNLNNDLTNMSYWNADSTAWVYGTISASNGSASTTTPPAPAVRTDYLDKRIISVKINEGYKYLIACYRDDNTYIGMWNGTTFQNSVTWFTASSRLYNLRSIGNYNTRIVIKNTSDTNITIDEVSNNVQFLYATDDTFTKRGYSADSYETGVRMTELAKAFPYARDLITLSNLNTNISDWEIGNVNPTTGLNTASSSRMRSVNYLNDAVTSIMALTGTVVLYAYTSNTYLGSYVPSTNTFEIGALNPVKLADISSIKEQHPEYKFRVVWFLSSSHNIDLPIDWTNVEEYSLLGYDNLRSNTLYNKNIVNMGDSIFGRYEAPTDISTYISVATGANCYNCAFGGTRAVVRNSGEYQPFDFGSLVTAIINNDFTSQDAVAESIGGLYPKNLATLKSIDFSKVDILTVSYGTNDYNADAVIGDVSSDPTTFIGALKNGIIALMEQFPQMRIVICTPLFRMMSDGQGGYESADIHLNDIQKTLTDYVEAVETVGNYVHAITINNYYLGVNWLNYQQYYEDSTHPNEKMRQIISNHICKSLS